MVKKLHKHVKHVKHISLGLVLGILILIIGLLYFTHTNVPEKKFVSNSHSESVMMPSVNYVYRDISVVDARKLIDKNLNNPDFLIIDVSLNYNEGHIVNAVNYPIKDGFDGLENKTKTYLVYARNEIDSLNAAKKLVGSGFENVYRLKGNYGAWVDLGYKTRNSY